MKKVKTFASWIVCLSLFYFSQAQNAPVTVAQHLYNPVPGQTLVMPVTVSEFEDIGSISLIFDYDPAVLSYVSALPNAAFNGFVINGATSPGRIIISWFAMYGVTLPDQAHLVDITFMFNGGATEVSWYAGDEISCEYAKYDNGAFTVLNDSPFTTYYQNGYVSDESGPLTWAPIYTYAVPGPIDIPVKVIGFNDIGAISLTMEYDPSVLVYQDLYEGNPILTASGGWIVGTMDAPGGKKYIRISWTKTALVPPLPSVNLPDSSIIINLKFNYLGGTSDLIWRDDGESCEYADGSYFPLEDSPTSDYYRDGLVTGIHYAPQTEIPCLTGVVGQPVIFPVRVYGFVDIGAISLTLDFDPAVITYQSISSSSIPSTFAIDANANGGRFVFGAMGGAGFSLPDGSILFEITFIYNGGSCLLTWNDDDPISCEYADGNTLAPLWDTPREDFYIDGCVGPAPRISGTTYLEGPYDTATGEMSTDLNDLDQIPSSQPYSGVPWNYTGAENVSSIPDGITDWVLVQLRTSTAASSAIATRAGFLTSNGAITELDGITALAFPGIMPGYYYMVIYHRNHMAVLSSTTYQVNPFPGIYDFSLGPAGNWGGNNGLKLIDTTLGRWGMVACDAYNDQRIYVNDYTDSWVPDFGLNPGYSSGDFNMDGKVYIDDYTDLWVPNFGLINVLP